MVNPHQHDTGHKNAEGKKPRIAVIDDNPFVLEAWQLFVDDAEVVPFASPSAFWAHADKVVGFLACLDCIVTDYQFDLEGEEDGLTFAATLKRRSKIPVILASDAELGELPTDIDARMPKEPMSYAAIKERLY